jgi:hypothetical protein
MSNKTHTRYKKKSLAACREASAAKKAAGLDRIHRDNQAERSWRQQMGMMPRDTRSITAFVMNDPIPGDPRCPWRPSCRVEGRPS